jgi:8-amino-7-oxononanoate synthase
MLDRMAAALAGLRDADQYRSLINPSGIALSSNDYLGLASHPRLKEIVSQAAMEDARVASTGSRLLTGNHERWEQLEVEFARFARAEAALYFPSGYLANVGLLSSILKPQDTVFSDAANHASLIDGIRLSGARRVIFPHLDLDYLEEALRGASGQGERIIVVESIFSMEGDRAPLRDLAALCGRFDAYLIIDEAHATGVETAHERSGCVLARVHTCGKAMASMGAFVVGSQTLREFLVNHARPFIFSTALPPYCAAHVRESLRLVIEAETQRTRLWELSKYLRARFRDAGMNIGASESHIIPLIVGSNQNALRHAGALSAAGFAIRAIRPPTVPAGSARLRFSVNANLSTLDLDRVLDVVSAI